MSMSFCCSRCGWHCISKCLERAAVCDCDLPRLFSYHFFFFFFFFAICYLRRELYALECSKQTPVNEKKKKKKKKKKKNPVLLKFLLCLTFILQLIAYVREKGLAALQLHKQEDHDGLIPHT